MFTFQHQKKYSFVVSYTFFFLLLPSLFLISCGLSCGVRKDLIPVCNDHLGKLPEEAKQKYRKLCNMLDDASVRKLEQHIRPMDDIGKLEQYIGSKLKEEENYKTLREFLPAHQAAALKTQVEAAKSLEERGRFINEYWNTIKIFHACNDDTRCHYSGLIKALPKEEAAQLKVKMVQCKTVVEIEELVKAKLPKQIQDLDNAATEQIMKLSDKALANVLQQALAQEQTKDAAAPASLLPETLEGEEPKPTDGEEPSTPDITNPSKESNDDKDVDASKTPSKTAPILDLNTMIADQLEKDLRKRKEENEDDGWGRKLPLQGQERKDFLNRMITFEKTTEKKMGGEDVLKELFNNTNDGNIRNFLRVYNECFSDQEQINLLQTMIALYRDSKALTIRLSNTSTPLGIGDQWALLRKTKEPVPSLSLLLKMQTCLSNLQ